MDILEIFKYVMRKVCCLGDEHEEGVMYTCDPTVPEYRESVHPASMPSLHGSVASRHSVQSGRPSNRGMTTDLEFTGRDTFKSGHHSLPDYLHRDPADYCYKIGGGSVVDRGRDGDWRSVHIRMPNRQRPSLRDVAFTDSQSSYGTHWSRYSGNFFI